MTLDLGSISRFIGDNWVGVIVIIYVAALIVTKLAEARSGFAALLGPLGTWIQNGRDRRTERLKKERIEDVEKLVLKMKDKLLPPDYESLKRQVDTLSFDMSLLRHSNNSLRAYVLYDEEWHFHQARDEAQHGIRGLAHKNYDEYYREYVLLHPVPVRARRINGTEDKFAGT